MTTPSLHESTGLSISAFTPTIVIATPAYTPAGALLDDSLAQKITAYSHELMANGGWWSATILINGSLINMEDWFDKGLNRHIEVYNPALVKIFEGFVNVVRLSAGSLSATRGPLLDVANRISVTYTPILDPTATPPIMGTQTTTTIANDTDSQDKYAILEDVVSGGRLLDDGTTDEAAQLRDTTLEESKDPESTEDLSLGSAAEPSVELEILGYVHRFSKYITQTLTAATVAINTKLEDVINDDPNGLFSTDFSRIDANAFLVSRYEDDDRMAWDVINSVVSIGDASDNRYTFGIYDNIQATYTAIPTTAEYQHRIAGPAMDIETFGTGAIVEPWDVLPARWIFLPDFLVGRNQPTSLRLDPRYILIESVRFTAPNEVQISGNKISKLPQLIAKQGMFR